MPDPAPVEQQLSAAPEPALTPVIRLELAALIEELIQTIDLQVPAVGVLLRAPHVPDEIMDILQDFYLWFGSERREIPDWKINDYGSFLNQAFLLGCTIEELHTAYRVGALVVWRHLSAYGPGMGVPPARMYQLAEHLFAHLERFSADSADAFGLLRTDVTYALKERRKRLIRRLVSDTPFGSPSILEAAREAQWRLPEKVVCVAVPGDAAAELRLGAALDTDVLTDLERSDPFLLMPATELPVRRQMLRRALEGRLHALGPALALKDVGMSLRMAKTALALAEDGVLADEGGQISCEDHLTTLLMAEDDGVMWSSSCGGR